MLINKGKVEGSVQLQKQTQANYCLYKWQHSLSKMFIENHSDPNFVVIKCRYIRSWFITQTLTMSKQSAGIASSLLQKRWLLGLLLMLSITAAFAFIIRAVIDSSCERHFEVIADKRFQSALAQPALIGAAQNPLSFMKSKLVLLVSHELSLSGIYFNFLC